jgi:sortase A
MSEPSSLAPNIPLAGRNPWTFFRSRLTQFLLGAAWKRTRRGAAEAKPWPWSKVTVMARMTIGRSRSSIFVLRGADRDAALAAPSHLHGSALPGDAGNCVIDSRQELSFHTLPFAGLQRLATGDRIRIERRDGKAFLYVVEGAIVTRRYEQWMSRPRGSATLTLISGLSESSGDGERLVVTARLLGAATRSAASRTFPRRRTLPIS